MEKTSTLFYLVNGFEEDISDNETNAGYMIDPEFREFKSIFDYLNHQIFEAPRETVKNILNYARAVSK
ncbi:MAG: hypothetical protein ACOC2F_04915 [Bacteroidota bacterium]